MASYDHQLLRQISLSQSKSNSQLTHPSETDSCLRKHEKLRLEASLEASCQRSAWPKGSHLSCSPHPILITSQHDTAMRAIHEALTLAIASIVERWWTDTEADFPQRMPLEPGEEALLRWIDNLHPDTLPPYRQRLGCWRPDFLVESVADPKMPSGTREQFRICEINSRFCWNGFLHTAYGQQALVDLDAKSNGFVGATDPEQVIDSLFTLYDPTKPLFLLKGVEPGLDIHMFVDLAAQRTGTRPIFVLPDDLRLVPDEHAKLGYRLCSVVRAEDGRNEQFVHNDDTLEEIHQVSLELHQHELRALSPEIMRALSVRCFNDMRTIFLVHDKRMLGIVLQELDNLVRRHGVLSATQAEALRAGICPTILAGSREAAFFLQRCRDSPTHKDGYLLKLIRSGKGAGIVFGDEVSAAEWNEKLLQYLGDAAITVGQPAYLVQRQIVQRRYEVLLRDGQEGVQANYLIGTYHALNGRYLGLGLWRSGPGRVCAISHNGAWICSVRSGSVLARVRPGKLSSCGGDTPQYPPTCTNADPSDTLHKFPLPRTVGCSKMDHYPLQHILAVAAIHPFYQPTIRFPPDADHIHQAISSDGGVRPLSSVPLTYKKDLYQTIQRLTSDNDPRNGYRRSSYISVTGGGSGGIPMMFATDGQENRNQRRTAGQLIQACGVIEEGDWVLTMHTSGGLYRSLDLVTELLENAGASVLCVGHLVSHTAIVQLCVAHRVNVISGDSSQILQFALHVAGLPPATREALCINKIIYTSEPLVRAQRQYLTSVLGPVAICSLFASAESGPWAVVNLALTGDVADDAADLIFDARAMCVEIIPPSVVNEDQPRSAVSQEIHTLPDGEFGAIVLTSLQRLRNPLVRYVSGDVGSLHPLPAAATASIPSEIAPPPASPAAAGSRPAFQLQMARGWQIILQDDDSRAQRCEIRLLRGRTVVEGGAHGPSDSEVVQLLQKVFYVTPINKPLFCVTFVVDASGFERSATGNKVIRFVNKSKVSS
ncbi:Circularly permuted ATP-grasp type 2 [Mycena sanguinolenta]|uniref:Circularly permuted ATP-grasp type 2 n=1 Tax=Mycena sanguinolenta TaxID=230812 RepID=A0A8H6YSU0_9AGAR|nr:Circularly permuted ATP-grasp type 2 [Mycena sanguinolenta]